MKWWNWLYSMMVWAEATDVLEEEEVIEFELGPNERIVSIEVIDE